MGKEKLVRLMDIQEVLSKNNINDIEKLHKAYVYAAQKHRGQLRKSGEPYLSHPLNVSLILAEMNMDVDTVIAGILHDTLEDTDATYEELMSLFGSDVAFLVDGVSKIGKISFKSSEEKMAENFRKMLISMSKDVRVIVIKLADRLHNMRTIDHLSEEKKQRIAKETMEIYAPLAHRLGIAWIKWELEDLSFRILNPDKYYEIYNLVKLKRSEREQYLVKVISMLDAHLKNVNISADVTGRPKHFYSIYSKMIKKKTSFDEIYDLLAVRVIVKTISDCYATLGIIHNLWKPISGRFKDYIAMPKANLYQSLHTTVVGPNGINVEIQIRTEEMHRIAEEGIAAHWKYKEGKVFDPKEDTTFIWLRQLLDQKELNKPQDLVEALKEDILPIQIYVFTPQGDVIELPVNSTPIDFAYAIHTKIGEKCVGAKVDGKMVNLKYNLKNGEKVEIITSPNQEPRADWLNIVKTNRAKVRIRNFLRKKEEEIAIKSGTELLAKEFESRGLIAEKILEDEKNIKIIQEKLSLKNLEEIYKAVGFGRISPKQLVNIFHRIEEKDDVITKPTFSKAAPFTIDGIDGMLTNIAKCCHPLPGDNLKGYISVGKGLIVHRADCPNLTEISKTNEDRIIDVAWAEGKNVKLPFKITTISMDKPGMISDITTVLKDMAINIIELSAKPTRDGNARQSFTVELSGKSQLDKIIAKLKTIPGVIEIKY
ncbi:MAG: bifunctional (p)ppGpp synthetase/guanosine-3',5'-bis(diphosphate) 3'-pyrophosphohydrolase [Calditerrivibrio sp.]|nr:bifunctional (p)ppGpp synthetase/guanosine-3',5'-bis(diphosphate) 3'-pyrophosphohydrolase [Calditerrivibrio sp.]MCA1932531.1 bifunctional (p)ppGpp synthetase/guanosine-3',5'-bis(diphosphate) 3'-pyrophosphohydrolase [Calditerrivibrio sp.]